MPIIPTTLQEMITLGGVTHHVLVRPVSPPLFHLSPAENVPSIQVDGLKASSDGAIYAFTDMIVADTIACNQVFASRYGVFRIMRRGITGTIESDDVAEFAAPYQRRIIQARVAPRHLRYLGTIDTDTTVRPTEWDYLIGERIYGRTRTQVDEEYAWRCRVVAEKKRTKEAASGPVEPDLLERLESLGLGTRGDQEP